MTLWLAIVLGVVQGVTEFLPISSSAHLRIVPALLGQSDPGAAFSAVIQLGTVLALLVYYRKLLFVEMPRDVFAGRKSAASKLPFHLVVGTIPIVVVGVGAKSLITGPLRSLYVIAGTLAVFGLVMYWVDRKARCARKLEEVTTLDALLVGLGQTLALVPGVSRSGATIVVALVLGLTRPAAARFSFLLGIPAIAGAGIYELKDVFAELGGGALVYVLVGTGAAAISGYIAIAWFVKFLSSNSLRGFAIYRIALACLIVGFLSQGVLEHMS